MADDSDRWGDVVPLRGPDRAPRADAPTDIAALDDEPDPAMIDALAAEFARTRGLPSPQDCRDAGAWPTTTDWLAGKAKISRYRRWERRADRRLRTWAGNLAERASWLPWAAPILAGVPSILAGAAFAASAWLGDALLWIGVALFLVGGAAEIIDAPLALHSPRARLVVWFDYMIDRASDLALYVGIGVAFWAMDLVPAAVLMFVALAVGMLASYGRAEAEALRFAIASRLGRLERLVTFAAVLASGVVAATVGPAWGAMATTVAAAVAVLLAVVTLCLRSRAVVWQSDKDEMVLANVWDAESLLPRVLHGLLEESGAQSLVLLDESPDSGDAVRTLTIVCDRASDGSVRLRPRKATGQVILDRDAS